VTRERQELGRRGEDRAAHWYRQRGYTVLDRNWRCRRGEIDLVVRGPDGLVFCEVKARTTAAFGLPQEAVTAAKQRRLRALAAEWLAAHEGGAGPLRFDVVAVLGDEVEVIAGAF